MRNWPGRCIRLWLLLTFFSSFTVHAQEYSYARYDVKDGLAGSVVYHGVEDKDGFLWFATETGVSRFDGTHFRNFTKADGLPDNEIIKFFVDSEGRVWMMPFRSSICYYWKGKINNQENDSLLKRIPVSGNIKDIAEDNQGNLLLMDQKALYFISRDHQPTVINKFNGEEFGNCSALGLSANGNFRVTIQGISGRYYVLEVDRQGAIVGKPLFLYIPTMFQSNYLSPGLEVFNRNDSLLFISSTGQAISSFLLPVGFNNLSVINDSLCSLNTGNGALFYDLRKGKVLRQILEGKNVNSVFQDNEGNSWFLTAGAGIFRIGSFEFNNYIFTENNKDFLAIYSIDKFDTLLYIGSEKSLLYTIDTRKNTRKSYVVLKNSINNRITSIARFPSGRIVVGTNQGVIEHKGKGKRSNLIFSAKSMQVDGERLLVSSEQGLLNLSEELQCAHLMSRVRSTCSFVQNKIYYNGTLNGLFTLDSTRKITWLGEKEPLFRSRTADIEGAPDGTLWVATHGDGLIGYKEGKITWTIRQKDGLTSDICRNVFIAGNDVWVGTDKGLNRVQWQKDRYKITTYSSADGLLSDIINAIYVDGSVVYVGTPAGLTTFDADKISLNSTCQLRMTGMQASGQPWAYDTTGFTLPPTNNAIRFDYVGISYRSAGDITYRYRLLGLNNEWQITRETFLNYLSLPSGEYDLQLIATNKFGVESSMVHIPFRVEKLLWEKTWFRVMALIIAWALIWIFVSTRIKRVRRQNDEKMLINNRMAELEQMALKAQMNPHFIFNSLNSVQQYVIDKDLLGANKFITEFSRLIRLTLDISSKTRISIYEEISYLATYLELEKTKFEDKFSYSIVVSPDMDTSDWFIPPMILQPYVENSIRHGVRYRRDNLGHIKVSFMMDEQYLICQVEDNGVGRQKAGQYKSEIAIEYQSKGMTLTARRIEMLNQNNADPVLISIEDLEIDKIAAGTRVTLRFPLTDAGRSN